MRSRWHEDWSTSMTTAVFILGTLHSIQCGKNQDSAIVGKFKHRVLEVCQTRNVRQIAEEMSLDALSKQGLNRSIPAEIATELRIPHCYCDPGVDERKDLGIIEDNCVELNGWLKDWSEQKIQEMKLLEWEKRENIWLTRLEELNIWPTLFICGSDHACRFHALLQKTGRESEVV